MHGAQIGSVTANPTATCVYTNSEIRKQPIYGLCRTCARERQETVLPLAHACTRASRVAFWVALTGVRRAQLRAQRDERAESAASSIEIENDKTDGEFINLVRSYNLMSTARTSRELRVELVRSIAFNVFLFRGYKNVKRDVP